MFVLTTQYIYYSFFIHFIKEINIYNFNITDIIINMLNIEGR